MKENVFVYGLMFMFLHSIFQTVSFPKCCKDHNSNPVVSLNPKLFMKFTLKVCFEFDNLLDRGIGKRIDFIVFLVSLIIVIV